MKIHLPSRLSPWVASGLITAAILALVLGAYGLTRLMSRGEILGHVEVAGEAIGGQGRDEALTTLVGVEERFANRPALFLVDGKFVSLQPAEAGFDLDTEAIADRAMEVGRSGNPFGEFWHWFTHIFSTTEIVIDGMVDDEALNQVFDAWDTEVIASPANPGGVTIEDGEVVPLYPKTGLGVDRDAAEAVVIDSMLALAPVQEEIPTVVVEAVLTDAEIDAAADQARDVLAASVDMIYDDQTLTFTVDQLIEAFRSETVTEGTPEIINSFDPEVVNTFLEPIRAEFEDEAVDARLEIDGDTVNLIPGRNGTRIDQEITAERLFAAGLTPSRRGELPIVEGSEPAVTTEYLEGLRVEHLVSQFTTYHDCCEDRVINIQRFADIIDGAIVLPGETFSLNEFVGERTEEKGFVPAGTIVAGEFEDTVGGGVSQFATTFYNAVFWGGYEDIDHRPHSYYFSRYPEGIEATINWRTPDLVFRNNRDHAILIDTFHTDTSITVRFFGFNDGRTIKGEQSGGTRKVWVDAEGGPEALHVKGSVSDRYSITEPGEPHYTANPDLQPGEQIQTQSEADGWSVTVTRTILRGGTDLVEEREWVVRYAPRFAVYEVHPCGMPGAGGCPTTTTIPPTTTTTKKKKGTTTTTEPGGSSTPDQ